MALVSPALVYRPRIMLHWRTIARLFGILLLFYSLSFIPSMGVSLLYGDGEAWIFFVSLLLTASTGVVLWLPNRTQISELSVRDGFLFVSVFWILLGMVGALPFMLGLHLDLTDAIFESVSGFTTTGATVIIGLDALPASILYHRQQISFLGGMGIVVLAMALLPLLRVGGSQLYRAETSGISKNDKLTPRISETARALWLIYTTLTLLCALAYWLAGMSFFDALTHAYATVATGGFSTHDASIAFFDSVAVEAIAIVFMLTGGVNFSVHFFAWRHRSLVGYLRDEEVRIYLKIFLFAAVLIAISLHLTSTYDDFATSLRHSLFQTASVMTSTGFGTQVFAEWPLHVPMLLIVVSFIGGCAGSTAGGIKVVRVLLLMKTGMRQMFQLAHPRAVRIIKLGDQPVAEEVLVSILGFTILYIAITVVLTMGMMAAGLDLESAFGAVTATINLLGPGLGVVASTFADVNPVVKWLGVVGMLVGRLEVFTLLILLHPSFWKG